MTHAIGEFYRRHEKIWPMVFFVGGFLFDFFMLDRIDSPMVIGQQFLYLCLIAFMLGQLLYEEKTPYKIEGATWLKRQYHHHRQEIMHFFFGTLLNAYAIFFFKSSSIMVSFAFMICLAGLLFLNESPRFRTQGVSFKFALLALCSYSFFSYVIPVLAGFMGSALFFFSLLVGYLPFVGAGWWVQRRSAVFFELMKTQVLLPATLVLIFFLGSYVVGIIPPVPLSIPFIGIYHTVDVTAAGYRLGHEKPWWRFWENGDQKFLAQPGDRVYIFFRLFAPARFTDQIEVAWLHKDPRLGWREEDRFPINIVGGRAAGFRGYGFKSHFSPGVWRAQVETVDGREIGRVYFDLELAPTERRNLEYVTQ